MKRIICAFAWVGAVVSLVAQPRMPLFVGETVAGEIVEVPGAVKSKAVLCLAYDQKASASLEAWMAPAYLRLVAKHGMFSDTYEADVWFVPMFVGMNKAAYGPTLKKFRKSTEPEVAEHVLFYQGELEPFQEALGMERKDVPYIFVIDDQGRVLHRTEGAFELEKLDRLEEVLMD
ncbi:MAG: hypothetical protein KDB88_07065 [Flavobacteriales bacterium]|nr:hypothetical protein [Flavobacteriales bacterium]